MIPNGDGCSIGSFTLDVEIRCPSCFEGCLFCQTICFIAKIVERIRLIRFDVHWIVTKYYKDMGQ